MAQFVWRVLGLKSLWATLAGNEVLKFYHWRARSIRLSRSGCSILGSRPVMPGHSELSRKAIVCLGDV